MILHRNLVKGKTMVGVNPQDLFSIKRIENGKALAFRCTTQSSLLKGGSLSIRTVTMLTLKDRTKKQHLLHARFSFIEAHNTFSLPPLTSSLHPHLRYFSTTSQHLFIHVINFGMNIKVGQTIIYLEHSPK